MQTVVLKVDDHVMGRFLSMLGHFKDDEVNILDESYLKSKTYLESEMKDMENGAVMIDEEPFWNSTEKVLRKYESK